ncbi:MAG TPA: four helix bundle protein [Flavisolibacter sp.]|nr:four helix bundle protein [Flavisolibacter sp.]
MATITDFRETQVWQLANQLHMEVYQIIKSTSLKDDIELRGQMERSSGSIMDNIAEGFGRGGRAEFIHFLTISKGSAAELQSQLIRCKNKGHIQSAVFDSLFELAQLTARKIGAFIQYLNRTDLTGPKFQDRTPAKPYTNNPPPTRNQKPETNNGHIATIETTNAAKPLGAYPHARRVGNLLFLSGIGPRSAKDNSIPGLMQDEEGNIISYDIEAECHSVFANVKAVLDASGSSWNKMVDVTVFLTNMKKDFPIYNRIYGEYFKDVQACRTTVEVKSLPTPIAIELKVIATID